MKVRLFLARKIVAFGVWLCHEAGNAPEADGYVAGKIALGLSITHDDIRKYQLKVNKSWRDCINDLIKARKTRLRIEISKKIDTLIEYRTSKGDDIVVIGDVKVYIPNGKKI